VIPQVIHRIWRGGPMPAEFRGYGRSWKKLNPGWKLREWGDSSKLPEMPAVFARSRELAPRDHLRFEADVMRLQILYEQGGVYVDCDIEPLKPLGELLDGVECFATYSPNRGPNGLRLLTNCALGAAPGHPFIAACIEGLEDSVRRFPGQHVAKMVGPWHVSRTYDEHPDGVTVFDEHVFSPQSNRERYRGLAPDLSRSYAWHHWANTRGRRR